MGRGAAALPEGGGRYGGEHGVWCSTSWKCERRSAGFYFTSQVTGHRSQVRWDDMRPCTCTECEHAGRTKYSDSLLQQLHKNTNTNVQTSLSERWTRQRRSGFSVYVTCCALAPSTGSLPSITDTFRKTASGYESSHDPSDSSGDPLEGPDPEVDYCWTELLQKTLCVSELVQRRNVDRYLE